MIERICKTCISWSKPSCSYGYGNCSNIGGKGLSKESDSCKKWKEKKVKNELAKL